MAHHLYPTHPEVQAPRSGFVQRFITLHPNLYGWVLSTAATADTLWDAELALLVVLLAANVVLQFFFVLPSPATHAILVQLKTGEAVRFMCRAYKTLLGTT